MQNISLFEMFIPGRTEMKHFNLPFWWKIRHDPHLKYGADTVIFLAALLLYFSFYYPVTPPPSLPNSSDRKGEKVAIFMLRDTCPSVCVQSSPSVSQMVAPVNLHVLVMFISYVYSSKIGILY